MGSPRKQNTGLLRALQGFKSSFVCPYNWTSWPVLFIYNSNYIISSSYYFILSLQCSRLVIVPVYSYSQVSWECCHELQCLRALLKGCWTPFIKKEQIITKAALYDVHCLLWFCDCHKATVWGFGELKLQIWCFLTQLPCDVWLLLWQVTLC